MWDLAAVRCAGVSGGICGALRFGASGGVEWILVFAIQCVNAGSVTLGFPECEVWCQLRGGFVIAREA